MIETSLTDWQPKSNEREVKDFLRNPVWQDILFIIGAQLKTIEVTWSGGSDFEDAEGKSTLPNYKELIELASQKKALEFCRDLPEHVSKYSEAGLIAREGLNIGESNARR